MHVRHLVTFILALAYCGCASQETIQQHIASHAREIGAQEYAPARMVAVGDLDGDGVVDSAVVYTLEGAHHSNNYQQFLAVSSSRQSGRFFDTVVGGKDVREITGISITNRQVELALLEYTSADASCCPSRRASTRYILKRGVLAEQARPTTTPNPALEPFER